MRALQMICLFSLCLTLAGCCGFNRHQPLLNPYISHRKRAPLPPAKHRVAELMTKRLKDGSAEHISVYFHALKTGYWFGINEHEKFIPASLLKIYLMIAVLSEVEKDPALLKRKIRLEEPADRYIPDISPKEPLISGNYYTVDRLLKHMIVYSDNMAAESLYKAFTGPLAMVYTDFGVKMPEDQDEDFITVKQYMMVFLSLYNATYLSSEMSQRALSYMVGSDFDKGLAAGMPPGVKLANKFGERRIVKPYGTIEQLHDLGIIYHHEFPYVLGVMTRGRDMNKLETVIKEISTAIYDEVSIRTAE